MCVCMFPYVQVHLCVWGTPRHGICLMLYQVTSFISLHLFASACFFIECRACPGIRSPLPERIADGQLCLYSSYVDAGNSNIGSYASTASALTTKMSPSLLNFYPVCTEVSHVLSQQQKTGFTILQQMLHSITAALPHSVHAKSTSLLMVTRWKDAIKREAQNEGRWVDTSEI